MKKGHIFFISGVTGAGKGTVIQNIIEKNLGIEFIKSVRTREYREHEIPGKSYLKYSKDEFKEAIANDEFLEYNFVHGQHYYGTRLKDIEDAISNGGVYLKEVDMQILPDLIEKIEDQRENFSFLFLNLPVEEIRTRMLARGDKVDDENYKNRVESAIKENKLAYLCDYIIDATQSKEEVFEEVVEIVKKYL